MHVVVPEPARLDHPQAEQNGGDHRVGVREELPGDVQPDNLRELPRLLEHVPLEEAILLQLLAEVAEGHGRGVLARGGRLELLRGGGSHLGSLLRRSTALVEPFGPYECSA